MAQDSLYTHWPTVQKSTFDPAQRDRIFQVLQEIGSRPVVKPKDAKANAHTGNTPGWEALKETNVFIGQRDFPEATRAVNKALGLARSSQDRKLEMQALGRIGYISREVFLGKSLKAVPYHEEALLIARELQDTSMEVRQLLALADNYGQAGRYDRMLEYAEPAAMLLQTKDLPAELMQLTVQFGLFLLDNDHPKAAEKLLRQAMQIAHALGNTGMVQHLYWQLFYIYLNLKDADKAQVTLDSVRAIGKPLSAESLYESYYQIEKVKGNREEALHYLEQAYRFIGESYSQRNADQLASWETRLRTREKELQLENQRVLLEKQRQTRRWLYGLIGLVSLLLLVAVYAWYQQRQAKRALSQQNQLIEQQSAELKELDQLKSRFFANVSHELRTPLTLILGPLQQALEQGSIDERSARLLKTARRNAQHLLTFVNEILDLSKLRSAKTELQEQPTVLLDFLKEMLEPFQAMAESGQIDLQLDYQPAASWTLALDRIKLLKILNNLLSNALKFTPPGGQITLIVEQGEKELCLQVRDTGSGIHPNDLPHVFDLYYQSKQPGARTEGGTGIGLALSRELTSLMDGKLWVESTPGKGSIFFLRLPAREVDPGSAFPLESALGASMLEQVRVTPEAQVQSAELPQLLIVEDNTELQDFLRAILSENYSLKVVGNGQEALDYLSQADQPPDLVLTDLMMPVMDGFQLVENLRQHEIWRRLPVILLTARADRSDRIQAFRIGIDDYLIKPFAVEELQVRIENALRNQSARREWAELADPPEPKLEVSEEESWLQQLEDCVVENLDNFQLNVDRLAELMDLSRTALYRRIREATGLSANQYIQEVRLQQARNILESGQVKNLRELAAAVGMRTSDYLSRLYRERFGKSPAEELQ
ncbi:MAG: ATP-binding protein [Saprospiraceae bacterium]